MGELLSLRAALDGRTGLGLGRATVLYSVATVKRRVKRSPSGPGPTPKGKSTASNRVKRCNQLTKAGERCKANARPGEDECWAHAPKEARESAGFGGSQPGAGRPRATRPVEAINQLVQSNVLLFIEPYLRAIGLEGFTNDDGELEVRKIDGGGVKLFSTDKGDVYVSSHEDLEGMQRAAERLFDRGFGKPVQTNLLGGAGEHGPVEIDVPTTAERLGEVAQVLKEMDLD